MHGRINSQAEVTQCAQFISFLSESMAASVDVGLKFVAFAACNALYDNTNIYTIMCPMHAGHVMFIFYLQIDGGTLEKRKKTSGVNR